MKTWLAVVAIVLGGCAGPNQEGGRDGGDAGSPQPPPPSSSPQRDSGSGTTPPAPPSHDPPLPDHVPWDVARPLAMAPDAVPQVIQGTSICGGGAREWQVVSAGSAWLLGTVQGANTTQDQGWGRTAFYPQGYSQRRGLDVGFAAWPAQPRFPTLPPGCASVQFQATAGGGAWSVRTDDAVAWLDNDGQPAAPPGHATMLEAHGRVAPGLPEDLVLIAAFATSRAVPACWSSVLYPNVRFPCAWDDNVTNGRAPAWLLTYANASLAMAHHALVDADVRWHNVTLPQDWFAPEMASAMRGTPASLAPRLDSDEIGVHRVAGCVGNDASWTYSPIFYGQPGGDVRQEWRIAWFAGGDAGMSHVVDARTGDVVSSHCTRR